MTDDLVKEARNAALCLRTRDNIRNGSDDASEMRQSPEWRAAEALEKAADEIERLRADLARPKVKPLEWVERRGYCYQAGPYQVCSNHNSGGMWRVKLRGRVILKRIRGLEKAQEWVSKHHEQRILSALEGCE